MRSQRQLFQRSRGALNSIFHSNKVNQKSAVPLAAAPQVTKRSVAAVPFHQQRNASTAAAASFNSGSSNNNNGGSNSYGRYFVFAGAVFCISLAGFYNATQQQDQEEDSAIYAEEKKAAAVASKKKAVENSLFKDGEVPIYRIVLTYVFFKSTRTPHMWLISFAFINKHINKSGGPCAGKSSAMAQLSERLKALGFQVFIVQEIATMMMTSGASFRPDMTLAELLAFESTLIKIQLSVEDSYAELARASKKPTVLLCDRGVMDPKAYLDADKFAMLLDMNNWNVGKLRDSRYDCIIHLVTAAYGAEKFYTLANNAARSESLDQAREVDNKLREAYIGHPSLFIVDNSTNFEGKLNRVTDIVSHVVGIPKPINSKRKYNLKAPVPNNVIDIPFEETNIEQVSVIVVCCNNCCTNWKN